MASGDDGDVDLAGGRELVGNTVSGTLEEENCRSEHEEDEGCVIACAGTEDGCFPALNSPRIDLAGGAS
uniref:Uncharacterized protein n=1 Tax=Oryza rufipogon TaxID=4529 RepID=A0A0E0NZF7_ORYRU